MAPNASTGAHSSPRDNTWPRGAPAPSAPLAPRALLGLKKKHDINRYTDDCKTTQETLSHL